MNKLAEISYLNSSTYAYCFTFNLIGEYSMNDNFLVDHICITCDRIAELHLAVFSHICNVPNYFCCGTRVQFRDNMISYDLLDIVQPTKLVLPLLDCSDLARLESNFSYPLCLSQILLPKCATDLYFTYICKLSCMFLARHNDDAHITNHICVCSSHVYISQSSAVDARYKPILFTHLLDWFDLACTKFDHRSSMRTLDLILNNKTLYIFVHYNDYDFICFTYTCNLSCSVYIANSMYDDNNDTTCYIYIYFAYTLFFLFLPFSAYPKPWTAFLEERRMMRIWWGHPYT